MESHTVGKIGNYITTKQWQICPSYCTLVLIQQNIYNALIKKTLKNPNEPFQLFPFILKLMTTENANVVSATKKIYFKDSFHLLMNNVQILHIGVK